MAGTGASGLPLRIVRGEARLGFWAESLGQYRQSMNTFFRLYSGTQPQTEENGDD